ncbi:MAG: PilZ domain-containing protein [Myxococcales bacterium]|nr:PilZ domain-containing protein [Myxococcales bacterium]
MRKVRCHYRSRAAFLAALVEGSQEQGLRVYTTERFDPGEELLCEVHFSGLPGKMLLRAVGLRWYGARPRLSVRAGGLLRCVGSELRKLQVLRAVAEGRATFEQRRRHIRHPVIVEVRWRRDVAADAGPGVVSEISEAGALLVARASFRVGEGVLVEIALPGSARPAVVQAVVRNVDHPEGVGIEFLDRGSQRLRELIRRLVDE